MRVRSSCLQLFFVTDPRPTFMQDSLGSTLEPSSPVSPQTVAVDKAFETVPFEALLKPGLDDIWSPKTVKKTNRPSSTGELVALAAQACLQVDFSRQFPLQEPIFSDSLRSTQVNVAVFWLVGCVTLGIAFSRCT